MENNLKSFKALEYLLIKNSLIDNFVNGQYEEGKWCLNTRGKNLYEICFVENGKKVSNMTIRYPEFACCYVLDVLTNDQAKNLVLEFCDLISMDDKKFNEETYAVLMEHEIEKSFTKQSRCVVNYLAKEHFKARRVIESNIRVRKR